MRNLLFVVLLTFLFSFSPTINAATITRYVDPDATGAANGTSFADAYTSLFDCEAAEQQDLTDAGGDVMEIHCRSSAGTVDSTRVDFIGWTTAVASYISIAVDAADRHDGKWTTGNVYRLEVTMTGDSQSVLKLSEDYVRVDGLQIAFTNDDFASARAIFTGGQVATNNDIRISNTIVKGVSLSGATDQCYGIDSSDNDTILKIWNCIVYDVVNGTVTCWGINFAFGATIDIYNTTVIGCRRNISCTTANTYNVYNSVAYGATESGGNWLGTAAAGTNNATEGTDAQMPQTDRVDNVVTGDFEDYASDDFHLASGSALEAQGVEDPASSGLFTDDIDGDTRAVGSVWDIGADEFVAAAGGGGGGRSIRIIISEYFKSRFTPIASLRWFQ